jgi:hypothetical protein
MTRQKFFRRPLPLDASTKEKAVKPQLRPHGNIKVPNKAFAKSGGTLQ